MYDQSVYILKTPDKQAIKSVIYKNYVYMKDEISERSQRVTALISQHVPCKVKISRYEGHNMSCMGFWKVEICRMVELIKFWHLINL